MVVHSLFFRILVLILGLFLSMTPLSAQAAKEKVLLDTDMVEAFDNGIALLLLAKAPNIELVGVTTVTGNTWVEAGTAYAIRQLEEAGINHIPVASGLMYPLRPDRHQLFTLERKMLGRGQDTWIGSFGQPKPTKP